MTFFCGGSRNRDTFIDRFDGVFVLDVDLDTLNRRLDERPADEFGHSGEERELVLRLHRTRKDFPRGGIAIDATQTVTRVVDDMLARCFG